MGASELASLPTLGLPNKGKDKGLRVEDKGLRVEDKGQRVEDKEQRTEGG